MCWHGEAFRRAEMCQSSPCLSDHSFIWSFPLVLRSNVFFPFICLSFPFSPFISFPSFSHCCTLQIHTFPHTLLASSDRWGEALESYLLSQVNVVEGGHVDPLLSHVAKPHIWQPPWGVSGSFHYEHTEVWYRNNSHLEITLSSFYSPVPLLPLWLSPFSKGYFRCCRISSFTFTSPWNRCVVSKS